MARAFTPGANTALAAAQARDGCIYSNVLVGVDLNVNLCGPQTRQGTYQGTAPEIVTRAQTPLQQILGQEPAPYSNPTTAYALPTPTVPDGFEHVWDDGRLNPNRGIPNTVRYATQPTVTPEATQPRVTTRAVAPAPARVQRPAEQISGHRYVQVGTFGTRDQAQAVAQALRSRGLPMRIGVYNQNLSLIHI